MVGRGHDVSDHLLCVCYAYLDRLRIRASLCRSGALNFSCTSFSETIVPFHAYIVLPSLCTKFVTFTGITGLFIADVLLNFNTSMKFKGEVVSDRKFIALHYLRECFWFDLVASFPLKVILGETQGTSGAGNVNRLRWLGKAVRLFRFFKLLPLLKIGQQ